MDLEILSKILRELVLEHNRVSLPGMGSFIAEKAPSVFSDRAMVIHPPFRRILFRPSEIWNDELLENKYALEQGYKIDIAKHEIAEFIKRLKVDLNTNKTYRIPQFGTMRATEQNDYFFVADKDMFNYVETFGLEPVNIKFLPRRGEVESLNGKPVVNFFKKDIRSILNSANPLVEEEPAHINPEIEPPIPILNPTTQEQLAASKEEPLVAIEGAIVAQDEPILVVEEPIVAQDEPILVVEEPIITQDEPILVVEEPIITQDEPILVVEEPIVTTEEPISVVEPPVPLAEPEPPMPPVPITPPVAIGQRAKDKPSSNKFIRNFVLTLSVIFLFILIIVLLVVFKEELRPFWEWILYSKEERELLRSSISSALS